MTAAIQEPPVAAPDPGRARMIAVASGKGGVGKTWLSITLAHALARRGRRVLLFDGDIGLANIDIQLGLTPNADLGMVLAGKQSFTEVVVSDERCGFDVIPGRSGSGSLVNQPLVELKRLIDGLSAFARAYDHVILDLGAGLDQTVRFLATQAGRCLVVTNDEPTAITDAYALIKLLSKLDSAGDLRVLINMARSRRDGERSYGTLRKACETFLGRRPALAGVLLRDPHVRESIRHQVPLLTRYPVTEAAVGVETLAKHLDKTAEAR